MLKVPFLTDLDSRAEVKGSRDSLGIQPIWTRFGRYLVGNLTTVSDSVRDFAVLLIGFYFAERLADREGPGSELSTFIKWEQLAAYSRAAINREQGFRGTERVHKNLAEESRITISADREHQILGNQKIYGLWGLYTVPARASGLVELDSHRLTARAREFVESTYLPILENGAGRDAERILKVLGSSRTQIKLNNGFFKPATAIARALKRLRSKEREFYRDHLLYGGPQESTQGRQKQLAVLMGETLDGKFAWSPALVSELAKKARAQGEAWHSLSHRLERTQTCEAVLAPVSLLFAYLLGLDGRPLTVATKRLREVWGDGLRVVDTGAFRELKADLAGPQELSDFRLGIDE